MPRTHGPATVAAATEIVFVAPTRLTAIAAVRTLFGRAGVYDVTVRRDDHVIAEFPGRSPHLSTPPAA